MVRTRIVATLGPASSSPEAVDRLLAAGVDVFRLNFSHGTHETHGRAIETIRRAAGGRPVAILQDLAGPKLRLERPVKGKPGDLVDIALPASVKPGEPVLLADGAMRLEVVDNGRCRVVTPGDIPAGKSVNLPSSHLDLPPLTEKDRKDLEFGVKAGVDFVAHSFVREASDLRELKQAGVPAVAKIENARALENIDAIVEAADGVMVARGDLGVEIPIERIPVIQKRVIALALRAAKPVITATQMLRSMVESPMPTRAEATDVANAALDGTDAVMLSEETAVGRYAAEAVAVMRRILAEAETLPPRPTEEPGRDTADVMAHAACDMARRVGASAIVVPTKSGFTARKIARFRPSTPIVALTPDEGIRRRLSMVWGITALLFPEEQEVLENFRGPLRASGLVEKGSRVVVTAGWPFPQPGITNLVHLATC